MPIPVTAYKVLIGSPSDVSNERKIVESAIHTWNSINGINKEKILIPVMWESDSVPLQGDRPQGILNDLMVKKCDIIIAVFWSRLGSNTGTEKSGTVEEIKYFIKEQRPALVYFSKQPLPQDHDPEQWKQLTAFKKEIRTGGIQADFIGDSDLSMQLIRHLSIVMDEMITMPTVETKQVKRLIKESAKQQSADKVSPPKKLDTTTTDIFMKKKTDKSFIVYGVSEQHQWPDDLHGQLVSIGQGKKAWQFSLKRQTEVALSLGIANELR
ncbi:hypothetical protein ACEUB9_11980 [Aeromonas veronii]